MNTVLKSFDIILNRNGVVMLPKALCRYGSVGGNVGRRVWHTGSISRALLGLVDFNNSAERQWNRWPQVTMSMAKWQDNSAATSSADW